MNKAVYFFLVLSVVLAASVAGFYFSGQKAAPGGVEADQSALDRLWSLELPDQDGKPRQLTPWRGKIIVVNFWATWCPPCVREIPGFARISGKYAGSGVQFVGIGVDGADLVRRFAQKMAIPYPILMGDMDMFQITTALGNPTEGLPFTLILDRRGKVAFVHEGLLSEDQLDRVLKTLVGAS